jgi:hypothetical protein
VGIVTIVLLEAHQTVVWVRANPVQEHRCTQPASWIAITLTTVAFPSSVGLAKPGFEMGRFRYSSVELVIRPTVREIARRFVGQAPLP